MGFGFKQPLVGEKRCVTTLITAAEETTSPGAPFVLSNLSSPIFPHHFNFSPGFASVINVN